MGRRKKNCPDGADEDDDLAELLHFILGPGAGGQTVGGIGRGIEYCFAGRKRKSSFTLISLLLLSYNNGCQNFSPGKVDECM